MTITIIVIIIVIIIINIAGMTSEEKGKFIQWHGKEEGACAGKFNFREQLMAYCRMMSPSSDSAP